VSQEVIDKYKKSEEEKTDNCDEETETKVDLRMWCPNLHIPLAARKQRQEEEALRKELTSELIIKSEPECR
jgi:hypothetical protein